MSMTLVRFSVGRHHCGLPVEAVDEVLRVVAVTPFPVAPPFVEGVINRRGVVTPVIDLRKRVGVACGPYDSTTRIVIARLGSRHAGLIVDDVSDVVVIDRAAMGLDPTDALGIDLRQYSSRIVRDGDDLVVVVDPAKILTDEEGKELDAATIP